MRPSQGLLDSETALTVCSSSAWPAPRRWSQSERATMLGRDPAGRVGRSDAGRRRQHVRQPPVRRLGVGIRFVELDALDSAGDVVGLRLDGPDSGGTLVDASITRNGLGDMGINVEGTLTSSRRRSWAPSSASKPARKATWC